MPYAPLHLDAAARWLGVTEMQLRAWVDRGRIACYEPAPGVYLFTEEMLWDYAWRHVRPATHRGGRLRHEPVCAYPNRPAARGPKHLIDVMA